MNKIPSGLDTVPIHPGLVSEETSLDEVRLLGSQCTSCGEVSLGSHSICPNCASEDIRGLTLSDEGVLYTYTIVRHKPPGNYLGPDPFEPFALGLVELPDGIRVMAPLEGELGDIKIGMKLKLKPWDLFESSEKMYRAFKFSAQEIWRD